MVSGQTSRLEVVSASLCQGGRRCPTGGYISAACVRWRGARHAWRAAARYEHLDATEEARKACTRRASLFLVFGR